MTHIFFSNFYIFLLRDENLQQVLAVSCVAAMNKIRTS